MRLSWETARLTTLALAGLLAIAPVAMAAPGGASFSPRPVAKRGALPGVPPFPYLLAHYAARPPWPVAGVDRSVGVPAGTTLHDPLALRLPGVSVDEFRHLIRVTGDGVKLDSIDFAREGGWGVLTQGKDTDITRCAFRVGVNNQVPVTASAGAAGLTIKQSTIDGGGKGLVGKADAIFALVDAEGPDLTVEDSWMRFAPVDAIDFNGGGTLIVQNNLFNNLGYSPGAHADSVQFTRGAVRRAVIMGNTVYDPQPVGEFPVLGGEGLQVEAQLGGAITHVELARNTVIATGPLKTAGYLIAIRQDSGSRLDDLVARDNYLDPTGGWGGFYPPSGSHLRFVHNLDMRDGKIISASTRSRNR